MPTFENLLKSRNKSHYKVEELIENRLAEMYLAAYRSAESGLKDLLSTLPAEENKLLAASKYGRLRKLLDTIQAEYKKLTGQAIAVSGNWTAQSYVDSIASYEWALGNAGVKVPVGFGNVPIEAVRASVFSESSGLTFIKTFQKNYTIELSRIQSAITRGLASGSAYRKIADELKDAFNGGLSDAVRVVRTEAGRAWSEAALLAHQKSKDLGIETTKVWSAAMDMRTRPSHGKADGQEADPKTGNFNVGGYAFQAPRISNTAPLSEIINCRCALLEILKEVPQEYRTIAGETVPYIKFSDWAEPRGWTATKGWPKGSEAYMSGLKALSKRK